MLVADDAYMGLAVLRQAEVWLGNECQRGIGNCVHFTCNACQESLLTPSTLSEIKGSQTKPCACF